MNEKFAIISGIPNEHLKETVEQTFLDGWTVTEQNYTGEGLWELILVKDSFHQPIDAS